MVAGIDWLFNIAGSLMSGWSGQYFSEKAALGGIYSARALTIEMFILAPVTEASVPVFTVVMGLVAQTQGLKFLSTLTGLVILSRETGSLIGAWLGGRTYDVAQDDTPMWWAAVSLGLLAVLIHFPIRKEPGPLALVEAGEGECSGMWSKPEYALSAFCEFDQP